MKFLTYILCYDSLYESKSQACVPVLLENCRFLTLKRNNKSYGSHVATKITSPTSLFHSFMPLQTDQQKNILMSRLSKSSDMNFSKNVSCGMGKERADTSSRVKFNVCVKAQALCLLSVSYNQWWTCLVSFTITGQYLTSIGYIFTAYIHSRKYNNSIRGKRKPAMLRGQC